MISERTFTTLSFVILAIMTASFILVLLGLVPRSWYGYLFALVLGLFLLRMAFRLILARQARLQAREKSAEGGHSPPHSS